MVDYPELWMPILLSAVLVFVASSLIHMVVRWHNADYWKLANEDEVRAAIRRSAPAPGQYVLPHCTDPKQGATPEMTRKFAEGPVGMLWLRASGPLKLGPFLAKWFVYCIVVSALIAYLARIALEAGDEYLEVFRFTGTATWLAYSWQGPAESIWAGKPWRVTLKDLVDGFVYGLVTAGAFGWLWPEA
jgi:hypothetical protein